MKDWADRLKEKCSGIYTKKRSRFPGRLPNMKRKIPMPECKTPKVNNLDLFDYVSILPSSIYPIEGGNKKENLFCIKYKLLGILKSFSIKLKDDKLSTDRIKELIEEHEKNDFETSETIPQELDIENTNLKEITRLTLNINNLNVDNLNKLKEFMNHDITMTVNVSSVGYSPNDNILKMMCKGVSDYLKSKHNPYTSVIITDQRFDMVETTQGDSFNRDK